MCDQLQDRAINGRFNAYHVMSPKRRWSTVEQVARCFSKQVLRQRPLKGLFYCRPKSLFTSQITTLSKNIDKKQQAMIWVF